MIRKILTTALLFCATIQHSYYYINAYLQRDTKNPHGKLCSEDLIQPIEHQAAADGTALDIHRGRHMCI